MFELNKKAMHAKKGLVRVMAINNDRVTLRKSGVYFEDDINKIRPITDADTASELLTNLEKICNERTKDLVQDTSYYYNLAKYGTLEDCLVVMKRFYLIRSGTCSSPLTPEESSIYAFAKDKAFHEISYIFSYPIEELEPYVKNQLHYVQDNKL